MYAQGFNSSSFHFREGVRARGGGFLAGSDESSGLSLSVPSSVDGVVCHG